MDKGQQIMRANKARLFEKCLLWAYYMLGPGLAEYDRAPSLKEPDGYTKCLIFVHEFLAATVKSHPEPTGAPTEEVFILPGKRWRGRHTLERSSWKK